MRILTCYTLLVVVDDVGRFTCAHSISSTFSVVYTLSCLWGATVTSTWNVSTYSMIDYCVSSSLNVQLLCAFYYNLLMCCVFNYMLFKWIKYWNACLSIYIYLKIMMADMITTSHVYVLGKKHLYKSDNNIKRYNLTVCIMYAAWWVVTLSAIVFKGLWMPEVTITWRLTCL